MSAAARSPQALEPRLVLEVDAASVADDHRGHLLQMRGNLRAHAGELVLVEISQVDDAAIWADAFVGLRAPVAGTVRLLGNEWTTLDDEARNELRARVGRVFSRGNWLEHLTLVENILLPLLHHTEEPVEELRREAEALARALGLPGLPLGMPDEHDRLDLQRAALVRGLLGGPLLIVLEDPTGGFRAELLAPLLNCIRPHRNRGAAVVWLSTRGEVWRDTSIPATRRYRMVGDAMMQVGARR